MTPSIVDTSAALRAALAGPRPALGGWVTLADPVGAELIARGGYDWVGIDAQHGSMGPSLVSPLQAIAVTATPALVRVAANDSAVIGAALDAGATGVIVPLVESAAEAAAAVAACRHAPAGSRSWGTTRAVLGVPGITPAVLRESTLCFVMAETKAAIEAIDAIATVEGIDGVFVGPSDLAISNGVAPGAPDATVDAQIERVARACEAAGVVAGIYAGAPAAAIRWAGRGFRLVALHNDAQLLLAAAQAELAEARSG